MRVLLIKTSSLGDVIHTLPALTDALGAVPDIRFDWVVEEAYAAIPRWHDGVDRVIPVALRRWRRHPVKAVMTGEWQRFRKDLNDTAYDRVIDAQGLLKSALITKLTRGVRCGLDWQSAREPLASLAYQQRCRISRQHHAITRLRVLFAESLGYRTCHEIPDYGIRQSQFRRLPADQPTVLFCHGTAWSSKQWPVSYWIALGQQIAAIGYRVQLPWGTEAERQRAEKMAVAIPAAEILPNLDLSAMATILVNAAAVVSVDTGLGHLATALQVPTVSLYSATNPTLTGVWGNRQTALKAQFPCAPCLNRSCTYQGPITHPQPACATTLPPETVWQTLQKTLAENP
jgi:heptosyltransferase-1